MVQDYSTAKDCSFLAKSVSLGLICGLLVEATHCFETITVLSLVSLMVAREPRCTAYG